MRVGIVGFLHESNTFIDDVTTLKHFQNDVDIRGRELILQFRDAPHELGGFIEGLAEAQIEAVPLLAMRATPYGKLDDEVLLRWQTLTEQLFAETGHLDGLLIAVHGAAVSTGVRDVDGFVLSQWRCFLGVEKPIIGTLDLHANLSQKMVDAATALVGYRTNPHIDQRERGLEAARLMARTLRGEVKPAMAAALPPVAINIERQLTAEPPCSHLYSLADEMLGEPMVLSNSILLGFPYSDVAEMGSSVVVVTDNEPQLAQHLANQLAHEIVAGREQFRGQFLSIGDALDAALRLDGPVCLLDMGDNVGGGSPGDGTALAREIHHRRIAKAFVCIDDAPAVQAAARRGVGKKLRLEIGGRGDKLQGPPLTADVTVVDLHDGKFTETGTTHGGITQFDQGDTAIVRTDHGLTIMLTSRRTPPFSLRQLTSLGINPDEFQIIVAKGVHAPRAAYARACRNFLRVDTPGVTRADMTKLEFHHRRRPLFPFEDVA